jgi:hypothetical protein
MPSTPLCAGSERFSLAANAALDRSIGHGLRPRSNGGKEIAEESEQQIPHRLKSVRDDKYIKDL